MHQALLRVEEERLNYEAEEKRRAAEEEARELEALKNKARAEIHAAEDKFNKGAKPVEGAVPWWDGVFLAGISKKKLVQKTGLRQKKL